MSDDIISGHLVVVFDLPGNKMQIGYNLNYVHLLFLNMKIKGSELDTYIPLIFNTTFF